MSQPLVTLRDVSVVLGGHVILRGLNADIQRGKISALIGLNGSGKTTFLRVLLQEIPYRGSARFHCGHDHSEHQPRHVGYVPQKLRIESHLPLTVRDLLALALQRRPVFFGLSRATRNLCRQLLERVSAPLDLLDRPVDKISGGELQRVLLGLALVPGPELLLLDEPAAGIDFTEQERFYDLINRINRENGTTILLVSHDISMVSRRADHVLCLRDGHIECQGTPKEVLNPKSMASVFGKDQAIFHHHHHHS